MANWSELHHDLLVLIAKRVNLLQDILAFGGVCSSWRSAAAIKENFDASSQIPWLMLAQKEDDDDGDGNGNSNSNSNVREFFNLTKKGGMTYEAMLPEARGKRCIECSLGWILTIAKDGEMNLLHPLSRRLRKIELPHQSTFIEYEELETESPTSFIRKAVLSASPSHDDDYVIMVIHGDISYLGFWRPGDKSWTRIETRKASYIDVTYYEGQFYAIDSQGTVVVCDVGGPNPSTVAEEVAGIPHQVAEEVVEGIPIICKQLYIVESSGALLIVTRDGTQVRYVREGSSELTYGTTGFQVFELDLSNNGRWVEIKSLGNRALFLGHSASISVEASTSSGIKPNSIYFTDDCFESYFFSDKGGGKDMGIYNLEDGSIEPHYQGESYSRLCPPIWVTPSF